MGLLLHSQNHTTLIQLATGFGKSLILALLAVHLHQTTGKKVIVVVPTPFLHLYQESNYCLNASRDPADLLDPALVKISYCSFDQFLSAQLVTTGAVLLVDEFHEIFFNQRLQVIGGKLISVVQHFAIAHKVIGVSATFRGEIGLKKINQMIADSAFINSPFQCREKEMQLQVFGDVAVKDIPVKAIALALQKSVEMPVILLCSSEGQCREWKEQLPESKVFGSEDAGEMVGILDSLVSQKTGVILTTSAASKGADFVFAVPQAYVIHTTLPGSVVQLKQDSGRGVRGSELPVLGAIFTEKQYTTLQQIEKGLDFADRFNQLYTPDYALAHSFLMACSQSNDSSPIPTFAAAVEQLNAGETASAIYATLSKVKRFKEFLPQTAPKAEFAMPAPVNKKRSAE